MGNKEIGSVDLGLDDLKKQITDAVSSGVKEVANGKTVKKNGSSMQAKVGIGIEINTSGGKAARKELEKTIGVVNETSEAVRKLNKSLDSAKFFNRALSFQSPTDMEEILKDQLESFVSQKEKGGTKGYKQSKNQLWETIMGYQALSGGSEEAVIKLANKWKTEGDNTASLALKNFLAAEGKNNTSDNTVSSYLKTYQQMLAVGIEQGEDYLKNLLIERAKQFNEKYKDSKNGYWKNIDTNSMKAVGYDTIFENAGVISELQKNLGIQTTNIQEALVAAVEEETKKSSMEILTANEIQERLNSEEIIPLDHKKTNFRELNKAYHVVLSKDLKTKQASYKNALDQIQSQMILTAESASLATESGDQKTFDAKLDAYRRFRSVEQHFKERLQATMVDQLLMELPQIEQTFKDNGILSDVSVDDLLDVHKLTGEYIQAQTGGSLEETVNQQKEVLTKMVSQERDLQHAALQKAQSLFKGDFTDEGVQKALLEYSQHAENLAKINNEINVLIEDYETQLAEKAAEEERMAEEAKNNFKEITSDDVLKKFSRNIKKYRGKSGKTETDWKDDAVLYDDDFYMDINHKLEAYQNAKDSQSIEQFNLQEDLARLYNEKLGKLNFKDLASEENFLLQKIAESLDLGDFLEKAIQKIKEQADNFIPTSENEILNELFQKNISIPNEEDVYEIFNAKLFGDDDKSIESFKKAIQKAKETKNNNEEKYTRSLVESYNRIESLGVNPWENDDVITYAGALQSLYKNITILENKLSELIADKNDPIKQYNKQVEQIKDSMQKGLISKAEGQLSLTNGKQVNLYDYAQQIKNTSAYLMNEIKEERAILYKDYERVGSELVGQEGKINIGENVEKYMADTLVHTHPFDSNMDYLRFSFEDINTMIATKVKEMILLCGEEMLTLDMKNIPKQNLDEFYSNVQASYVAIAASYGAQLRMKENGNIGADVSGLSKEIQNEMAQVWNRILAQNAKQYGGDLFIEKQDNENAAWDSVFDNRQTAINSSVLSHINKYIQAYKQPTMKETFAELQRLQGTGDQADFMKRFYGDPAATKTTIEGIENLIQALNELNNVLNNFSQTKNLDNIVKSLKSISDIASKGLAEQIKNINRNFSEETTTSLSQLNTEFGRYLETTDASKTASWGKLDSFTKITEDQYFNEWQKVDRFDAQVNMFSVLSAAAKEAGIEFTVFKTKYDQIMQSVGQTKQAPIQNELINYTNSLDIIVERLQTIANLISSSFGLGNIFDKDKNGQTIVKDVDWSKLSLSTKDVSKEAEGFGGLEKNLSNIVNLIQQKNQALEAEINLVSNKIPQEGDTFSKLVDPLTNINTQLSNIITNLSQINPDKLSAIVTAVQQAAIKDSPEDQNMKELLEKLNTDEAEYLAKRQAELDAIRKESEERIMAEMDNRKKQAKSITYLKQSGEIYEPGTTWVAKLGYAKTQKSEIIEDKETQELKINDYPVEMDYKSLSTQIADVDKQILTLERDIVLVQNQYKGIDLSPWKNQLAQLREEQGAMLAEAREYATRPEYITNKGEFGFDQFSLERKKNRKRLELELSKKENLDVAREQEIVAASSLKLQNKLQSINSRFAQTAEYQDVQKAINSIVTLQDVENASKVLTALDTKIKSVKDNLKSGQGSLDTINNAFNRLESGEHTVKVYEQAFQKLGLSAEQAGEKVAPLRKALEGWQESSTNLNSLGGMELFGTRGKEFSFAEKEIKNQLTLLRNQNTIDKKTAKEYKTEDVNNYKSLLVAMQQVVDARKQLQAIESEANNNPKGWVNYEEKIQAATEKLDYMKESLSQVLQMLYGETDINNLTADFFTNSQNNHLYDAKSLTANQLKQFKTTYESMIGSDESLDNTRLSEVASRWDNLSDAIIRYSEAMANGKKNTNPQMLKELGQAVITAQKDFDTFVNDIRSKYPELQTLLDPFVQSLKQSSSKNGQFWTKFMNPMFKGLRDSFSSRITDIQDIFKDKTLNLTSFKITPTIDLQGLQSSFNQSFNDLLYGKSSWEEFVIGFEDSNNKLLSQENKLKTIIPIINQVQQTLSSFGNDSRANLWTSKVESLRNVITNAFEDPTHIEQYKREIKSLLQELSKIQDVTKIKNSKGILFDEGQVKSTADMSAQMDKLANSLNLGALMSEKATNNGTKLTKVYKDASGQTVTLVGNIQEATNAWRMQMNVAQGTNAFLSGFTRSLGRTISQLPMLITGYSAIMALRSELTQGLNTFKEYDTTLTNISYTMGLTSKELDNLGKSAINMAKDLSMSLSNAQDVYKIYANMNTTAEEIQELATPTVILSNLSGVDASTAADEVQGIIQQFDLLKDTEADAADVSMHVVDVLNDVSANVAMDYAKGIEVMTQAVTATGQVAHDAGMSFEQLAAISAKVAERTREDGSTIGNAIKTIITRISKVGKMPAYADEVDNETLSNASASLAAVGVEVYKPSGEMNELPDILSALREKWDDLTDAQKSNIAFNIAATRQTSKFKNILMAWTDAMELAEHATISQGGALENQQKYEESVVGKTQQISTQMESFWVSLYSSDATKSVLDFIIRLTEAFNTLGETISPLGALMSVALGAGLTKSIGGGLFSVLKAKNGLMSFSSALKQSKTLDTAKNLFASGKDASEIQDIMAQRYPGLGFDNKDIKDYGALSGLAADYQRSAKDYLKNLAKTVAAVAVVTAVIYALKKAYDANATSTDAIIKRNQELIKQDQEKKQAIQDDIKEYDNNASSLQKLLTTYEEAEMGTEEWYNARQQIAEQFPSLVAGYDSEGRAIIANSDIIKSQISEYGRLAQAKKEALKQQAEDNINRETGLNNESVNDSLINSVPILGSKTWNSNINTLVQKRDKLEKEIAEKRQSHGKVIQRPIYGGKDDRVVDYESFTYDFYNDETVKKKIEELDELNTQVTTAQEELKQNYALIIDNLDTTDEQLIGAVNNFEEIAVLLGDVDPTTFLAKISQIKGALVDGDDSLANALNTVVNPNYSEIKAADYFDVMLSNLHTLQDEFGLTESQFGKLLSELDISQMQHELDNKKDSFLHGLYNGKNNTDIARMLGIDLDAVFKDISASDLLELTPKALFETEGEKYYAKQWQDTINQIQKAGLYSSDLSNIDPNTVNDLPSPSAEQTEAFINYTNAVNDAVEAGVDLEKRKYGNIDLDNRQEIRDMFKGTVETVLGASGEYDGVEIAFSPILQTSNGARVLDDKTVDDYINGLISRLGEGWTTEQLLDLDAQEKDWTKIKGLIADVGETARATGEQMHYSEAVKYAKEELDSFKDANKIAANDLIEDIVNKGLAGNRAEAIDLIVKWNIVPVDDNADLIEEAFNNFKSGFSLDITSLTTGISAFNSALSEMQKNGSITTDTLTSFTAANENYKQALVESSSGMQLNAQKFKELKNAEEDVIRTKLTDEIKLQSDTYDRQTEKLQQLITEYDLLTPGKVKDGILDQINAFKSASDATKENIEALQQLQAEYDATKSRYKNWQDVQSNGTSADQYDTIREYKDTFKELHEQGRIGDESFEAFVSMFTGIEDFSDKNADHYYSMISDFMKDYFTEDYTGPDKMYNSIMSALKGAGLEDWIIKDEKGNETGWDIKNYDILRHVMSEYFQGEYGEDFQVTSELMEIIGKAMKEFGIGNPLEDGSYTMDVDAQKDALDYLYEEQKRLTAEQSKYADGSSDWQRLQKKINEVQEEINGTTLALKQAEIAQENLLDSKTLQSNMETVNNSKQLQSQNITVDVPLVYEDANQAEASLEGLMEAKRALYKDGNVQGELIDSSDAETVKALDELLRHAYASKQALIKPAYIDIQVSDVAAELDVPEEKVQAYKNKLDELRGAMEEQELAISVGDLTGFQEANDKIETLRGELQGMDSDGELANAFNIDVGSLDDIHEKLLTDKGDIDSTKTSADNLSRTLSGMPTVNSLISESAISSIKTANGQALTLKQRLDNIHDKTVTVTLKAKGTVGKNLTGTKNDSGEKEGGKKYTGTASFAHGTWSFGGSAFARGDIGAEKTETALVGELGPEIRVRGSKWELLGQNGAEFTDVHKGDIIFNHKQTKQLLKNGHIDSRGEAIAKNVLEEKIGSAYNYGTFGVAYNKGEKPDRGSTNKSPKNPSPSNNNDDDDSSKKKKSNTDKKTDKALEDFKKALENIVDWIEVKLSRQTDLIDKYISTAESKLDRKIFDSGKSKKYNGAVQYREKAIDAIYDQIANEDRGSQYYYEFAHKQMTRAKESKLISSKDIKYYEKLVQEGNIQSRDDIQQFVKGIKNPATNKKLKSKDVERLTEVISIYKEWYEKGRDAENAIAELNEQLREQVKAIKEVRDAERDLKIERSNSYKDIATGGFESTADTDSTYSNIFVDKNNTNLTTSNKAYKGESKQLAKSKNKFAKRAKSSFSAARKEIKKTTKKGGDRTKKFAELKKLSKKYKKKINTLVKANKPIPEKILEAIQKISPDAYARLLAYNESLENWQTGLLEEAAAYASNQAEKFNNEAQRYENNETAYNNSISLDESKKTNKNTYQGKNGLLTNEQKTQRSITKNAKNKYVYYNDLINGKNGYKNKIAKASTKGKSDTVTKAMKKAKKAVSQGKPIPNMDILAKYYSQGLISRSFYYNCINYNEALEHQKDAKYAWDIAKETEKEENSARALEKVTNIQQQSENERNSKGNYNKDLKQYRSNEQIKTSSQSNISLAEAHGHYASVEDYTKQIQAENRNIANLIRKRDAMIKSLQDSIKSGDIVEGSEDYYAAVDAINEMSNTIADTTSNIKDLSNAIRDLDWQKFDDGMDAVKRFNAEIDHYLSLLNNQELFDEDNKGSITEYGLAALDLHNANMASYVAEAEKYSTELNDIYTQITNNELDMTDQNVIDRINSLTDAVWQSTEAAEAEKQAMIDLARQGFEAQLSYLNDTISKYKELQNAEKEAYEYQKQISNSSKNITNLEKQLAAFEGNTSEEAVAKVQKLRADLKDAREEQADNQYDKYISDSQQMLDDLSNNFQEWIDYYLSDRDRVVEDMKEVLKANNDDLGNVTKENVQNTINTLQGLDTSLGNKIGTATDTLSLAFQNSLKSVLTNNEETVGSLLEKIYLILTKDYATQQANQQAASTFEATTQGFTEKFLKNLKASDEEGLQTIVDARNAYNALTPDQKELVSDEAYNKLLAAEAQKKKVEDDAAKKKAEAKNKVTDQNVIDRINSLTDAVWQSTEVAEAEKKREKQIDSAQKAVDQAQAAYNKARTQYLTAKDKLEELKTKKASSKDISHAEGVVGDYKSILTNAKKNLEAAQKNLKKVQSYSTGAYKILSNQLAYTQDGGQEVIYRKSDGAMLTPLGKGDKVFTAAMSENLWKLAQMNIPDMINNAMAQPIVQNTNQNINQSVGDIQFVINLNGIQNYDQFKTQLVADSQFQNALQEMTLGAAMGRNSMSKYKYVK